MLTGWRYRVVGVCGVGILTVGSVLAANHLTVQSAFTTYVPLFNRLEPVVLSGKSLQLAVGLTVVAVIGSLVPLFKPRPRRILDTILLTQKRVLVAGLALATLGYFEWSHRLPRATLTMTIGILLVTIPVWFVWIRRRPPGEGKRAVIVGDDFSQIEQIIEETDLPYIGYLAPTSVSPSPGPDQQTTTATDGGIAAGDVERIGGLSRIEDKLVDLDIDTVVLAFRKADREEFFGALDACYEHGVAAKIHREYADNVLTGEGDIATLVDVKIRPWDVQDYMLKRVFDVLFASTALLVLLPVVVLIATVIKLDSDGPVFFKQERTRRFGSEFTFYKFRTMVENAEELTGVVVSAEDAGGVDPRVTRAGRVLRKTHLDEIPQLWSILSGEMSVVGPRPAQSEIEGEFERSEPEWAKRWFVKPGLTGLAQINDATGHEPDEKLYYDLEYIRRQSVLFDLKIVLRQISKVIHDVASLRKQ